MTVGNAPTYGKRHIDKERLSDRLARFREPHVHTHAARVLLPTRRPYFQLQLCQVLVKLLKSLLRLTGIVPFAYAPFLFLLSAFLLDGVDLVFKSVDFRLNLVLFFNQALKLAMNRLFSRPAPKPIPSID